MPFLTGNICVSISGGDQAGVVEDTDDRRGTRLLLVILIQ